MAIKIWVNIGSGNGLLPDGTKPLPESMLTSHRSSLVAFIWGQFRKRYLSHHSLKLAWKLNWNLPGANELRLELHLPGGCELTEIVLCVAVSGDAPQPSMSAAAPPRWEGRIGPIQCLKLMVSRDSAGPVKLNPGPWTSKIMKDYRKRAIFWMTLSWLVQNFVLIGSCKSNTFLQDLNQS